MPPTPLGTGRLTSARRSLELAWHRFSAGYTCKEGRDYGNRRGRAENKRFRQLHDLTLQRSRIGDLVIVVFNRKIGIASEAKLAH
jgi:hypothetical protein